MSVLAAVGSDRGRGSIHSLGPGGSLGLESMLSNIQGVPESIDFFSSDDRGTLDELKIIEGVPRVVENNETGNSRGKMQQILLCDIFR